MGAGRGGKRAHFVDQWARHPQGKGRKKRGAFATKRGFPQYPPLYCDYVYFLFSYSS